MQFTDPQKRLSKKNLMRKLSFAIILITFRNLRKTRPGVQQCQAQGLVFCP